jgi:hypothetical protein
MLGPLETANLNHWICFRPQVRGETPTLLGPLERANLNQLCFLVSRIPDDGQSPKTQ